MQDKVYFIQNGSYVKIGYSKNPLTRLADLQVANHDKLLLIGVIPGGEEKEKELHQRFYAYKARGEWFAIDGELKQFLLRKAPFMHLTHICTKKNKPIRSMSHLFLDRLTSGDLEISDFCSERN